LYSCMKYETPELTMDSKTIELAKKPIVRMLEMSSKLGL